MRGARTNISTFSRMKPVYLVDGVRTPIGSFGGSLAHVRADDLAAHVIAKLLERHPNLDRERIADVMLGCANQAGEDNRNVARMALLLAGLPVSVPGETVNRLCASGMSAVANASRAVREGDGDVYIAGGVEQMTRAPYVLSKSSQAVRPQRGAVRHQPGLAVREPQDARALRRGLDGPDRGERGDGVRDQPGGPGPVRPLVATEDRRQPAALPVPVARSSRSRWPAPPGASPAASSRRTSSPARTRPSRGSANSSPRSGPTARGASPRATRRGSTTARAPCCWPRSARWASSASRRWRASSRARSWASSPGPWDWGRCPRRARSWPRPSSPSPTWTSSSSTKPSRRRCSPAPGSSASTTGIPDSIPTAAPSPSGTRSACPARGSCSPRPTSSGDRQAVRALRDVRRRGAGHGDDPRPV